MEELMESEELLHTRKCAWNLFPEGMGCFCWEVCSASDLSQFRTTCTADAKLFQPVLVTALKDQLRTCSSRHGRHLAVTALGKLRQAALPAVPELLCALRDGDRCLRELVASTLGQIGEQAFECVPELVNCLADDAVVRIAALDALGNLGVAAAMAVPRIAEHLSDDSQPIRHAAVQVLGKLALSVQAVIPHASLVIVQLLLSALEDDDWGVRLAGASALCKILESPVNALSFEVAHVCVPGLVAALADEDEDVRAAVVAGLGASREAAAPAIKKLASTLADPDCDVRTAVLHSLQRIGRAVESAEGDIANLLAHEHWGVREAAVTALGALEELKLPSVLGLVKALTDQFVCVRTAAARAIGKHLELAPIVVQTIMKLLIHEHLGVRCTAAETLGALGPAAAVAASALEKRACTDVDCSVREAATAALERCAATGRTAAG